MENKRKLSLFEFVVILLLFDTIIRAFLKALAPGIDGLTICLFSIVCNIVLQYTLKELGRLD